MGERLHQAGVGEKSMTTSVEDLRYIDQLRADLDATQLRERSALEQARRARESAAALTEKLIAVENHAGALNMRLQSAIAQRESFAEIVITYAQHLPGCKVSPEQDCTCGLLEVIGDAKPITAVLSERLQAAEARADKQTEARASDIALLVRERDEVQAHAARLAQLCLLAAPLVAEHATIYGGETLAEAIVRVATAAPADSLAWLRALEAEHEAALKLAKLRLDNDTKVGTVDKLAWLDCIRRVEAARTGKAER
jgi:hypothetical protein